MSQEPERSAVGGVAGLDTLMTPALGGGDTGVANADGPVLDDLPAGAGAVLLVRRGPNVGRRYAVSDERVTVVGRHGDCDIVLSDTTVSRRHAEIRPDGHRFLLVDTGSLNGSYLNHQPVGTGVLGEGDEVTIGIFRFTFHAGVASSARTAPDDPAAGADSTGSGDRDRDGAVGRPLGV